MQYRTGTVYHVKNRSTVHHKYQVHRVQVQVQVHRVQVQAPETSRDETKRQERI